MRFFTERLYREMQLSSLLAVPRTKEGWDEELAFCREIGVDYVEQAHVSLAHNRKELLALLPAKLHPYVLDGTLNQPYAPPELAAQIAEWRADFDRRRQEFGRAVREAYESVKEQLPPAARELWERSLHDAQFVSCERRPGGVIELRFDESTMGKASAPPNRLVFSGVGAATIPDDLERAYWYGEEFELAPAGFALLVLLQKEDGGFTELRIEAESLEVDWA
ncbi:MULTISPECIES: DUF4085 family protein [Saccharibacillus]|uniref:DUF4085 family protein n=1 Tax=Saccharibacillus TaxID=456492 RepID=UPI001239928C|nr:DUF4085 family protein [Saccharibacillus sp. WB 17]MWJ32538.1 DUF4085 family protein [Saccharibacillus sp. WB 17]